MNKASTEETRENSLMHGTAAENVERFREVADAMPLILWTADPDGEPDFYNRRWYEFSGLPEGLDGDQNWEPILHPSDRQCSRDAWSRAIGTGEPYESEYRLFDRQSGRYRWYLGRALPVRDDDGLILRWYGASIDIDEQKQAQTRLVDEGQVAEAVNQIGSALAAELDLHKLLQLLTDRATSLCGAQFGAFFYNDLNEQSEAYMLYTLSGVPAEAFSSFPMPRNTAIFEPTFRGAGPARLDDVTKDPRYGKSAPYYGMPPGHLPVRSYLAIPVLSRTGEVLGGLFFGHETVGVFTEGHEQILTQISPLAAIAIDNARLYQEATRRAEALAEADRRKNEFLAMLAHELRNPLSPIVTASRILERHASDDPVVQRQIEIINRQARQITRLLDDLLEVARITRGAVNLKSQTLDLRLLVGQALETCSEIITYHKHELTASLPDQPVLVEADPLRIEQIVCNLVVNAAKYTEPGGQIRVALSCDADSACLRIRDNGMGILSELLPHIFDLFTQGERALDRSQGGLGLGLTLVRNLVDLHGGSVQAFSDGPGHGSEFVVSLPLAAPEKGCPE